MHICMYMCACVCVHEEERRVCVLLCFSFVSMGNWKVTCIWYPTGTVSHYCLCWDLADNLTLQLITPALIISLWKPIRPSCCISVEMEKREKESLHPWFKKKMDFWIIPWLKKYVFFLSPSCRTSLFPLPLSPLTCSAVSLADRNCLVRDLSCCRRRWRLIRLPASPVAPDGATAGWTDMITHSQTGLTPPPQLHLSLPSCF